MEERTYILNELEQVAPALAGIPKEMPFSIPEGYFEYMPVELLGKITLKNTKPAVPEGYFDSLPGILLSKIKAAANGNELSGIAPSLIGLDKKMPYSVPTGYFEMEPVIPGKEETPVISIGSNKNKKSYFRLVAAASVVIIAGLFTWFYFSNSSGNKNSAQPVAVQNATTAIDSSFAAALSGIEDTTLHSEINGSAVPDNSVSALYYLNTDNIETALRDISEEEIKHQLAEQGAVNNKS